MSDRPAGRAPVKVTQDIARAVEAMEGHEAVHAVTTVTLTTTGVAVIGDFEVPLPSRQRAAGVSKTEVRAREPVTFVFPKGFPFEAPAIELRADFPRTFAHINPSHAKDRVLPCIADIPVGELLHEGLGFARVLDEVARWLAHAAAGTLIDPAQGWQPMRRDFLGGLVTFSTAPMVKLVTAHPGYRICEVNLVAKGDMVHAKVNPKVTLDDLERSSMTHFGRLPEKGETYSRTVAVVAWGAAKGADGKARIDREYIPDTVADLTGLLALAASYGVGAALSEALQECSRALAKVQGAKMPTHILAVVCARRPFNLIGSEFSIECLPYAVAVKAKGELPATTAVQPLAHREDVSSNFLRRLAGSDHKQSPGPIVMLGAGSLGSKIGMHLVRAGLGPLSLVDKSFLDPHHLARHAVAFVPETRWSSKSGELLRELHQLSPDSTEHAVDIVEVLSDDIARATAIPKTARLAIETTGSLAVQEYLARLPPKQIPRVAHSVLFSSGHVGLLAVEGATRNPRVDDLVAHFYQQALDNAELAERMAADKEGMQRVAVGHGCGSYSMILPDSRLSVAAGGIGERLRRLVEGTMLDKGILMYGLSNSDGLGYSWVESDLGKTDDIAAEDQSPWRVRILRPVVMRMEEEAKRYSPKETGSGVVGHLSILRRCITITGLIPAPPDSVRRNYEFIMGVDGVREEAMRIHSRSAGKITYLGTWHSHPQGGRPSPKDYATFERIRVLREGVAGVVLVWTPHRFFALAG